MIILAVLLVGAVGLEPAARRLALTGLVPFLLGTAASVVRPGGDMRTQAVNAGLQLLGLMLVAAAALMALRRDPRAAAPGAALLLGGAGAALWSLGRALHDAGGWPPAAVAVLAAGMAAATYGIGGALGLGARVRQLDARLFGRGAAAPGAAARGGAAQAGVPEGRDALVLAALVLAGLAAAWAGRHVAVVFGGALLAVAAAERYRRRLGAPVSGLVVSLAFGLALAVAYWLLATIAGPVGLSLDRLGEVPLSAAAETAVAVPIAFAVWLSFALWPIHNLAPSLVGTLAGAAVWLRVGAPAVPHGLAHWQPLLAPLAVIGIWHGAVARRPHTTLRGLALLALASLAPESARGALLLLAAAGALRLNSRLGRAFALVAAGLGALFALEAGLRAQVVYTVLAAAGLALAAWAALAEKPRARNLPSAPPP
jgi:hypothetical protein